MGHLDGLRPGPAGRLAGQPPGGQHAAGRGEQIGGAGGGQGQDDGLPGGQRRQLTPRGAGTGEGHTVAAGQHDGNGAVGAG